MSKKSALMLWAINELYYGETKTTDINKPMVGATRHPSTNELKKYFQIAEAGIYNPSSHWCGIFATYLLKKANVRCRWENRQITDLSGGMDLEIVLDDREAKKGLMIGDIVKIHHNEHHFMVLSPTSSGFIQNFEGNAGGLGDPLLASNWLANSTANVVEDVYTRYRVLT